MLFGIFDSLVLLLRTQELRDFHGLSVMALSPTILQ